MKQPKLNRVALATLSMIGAGLAAAFDRIVYPSPRRWGAQRGELDMADPVAIKKALDNISDSVKEEGAKVLAKAEKGEKIATETKEQVDKLLTQQGELKSRLEELEKKAVRPAGGGEVDPESLQAKLEKAAPDLKAFAETRDFHGRVSIPVSRKSLTNTGTTGAALNYPGDQVLARPLQPLQRRLTIRDLLAAGRTTKAVVFYLRESGFTNAAAMVSEGSLKPKSEITFELINDPVRTIAHLLDISLQMLDDVAYIESYITNRLMYGLKLKEEDQLLNGSGVGQNIEGLYTAATAYSAPSGAAIAGTASETDLDKLRLALLQVELAYASANGIILHPTDWANIELLKDSQGRYLIANPQNTTTGRIWGRDVVSTVAMTQGRFLVGDFATQAQIFDRQDANVAISFENKDNFERNMATLRVEERLTLSIYRPEALIKGTLESAS